MNANPYLAQLDNLQRFQVGAFVNTQPFTFTVPDSTGGFIDVVVPANSTFRVRLLDSGNLQDGDRVAVTLASAAGVSNLGQVELTFAGQDFSRPIAPGPVELRLRALNVGTDPPNTGGVRILSPVLSGPRNQDYELNTGETGVLRVIAE